MGFLGKNRGSTNAGKNNIGGNNGSTGSYNRRSNVQGFGVNRSVGGYGRNLASRRPSLFCDHCKMSGTFQKCYKMHNYPLGHRLYRSKRVRTSMTQEPDGTSWIKEIHGSNSTDNKHAPADSLPTLSVEQY